MVPNYRGDVIHKLPEENLSGRHSISNHLIIEYKQSYKVVKNAIFLFYEMCYVISV